MEREVRDFARALGLLAMTAPVLAAASFALVGGIVWILRRLASL